MTVGRTGLWPRIRPSPAQAFVLGFLVVIAIGTGLLSLPAATASGEGASPIVALFTATSAVCVTGLIVVDTGSFWSPLGQGVIIALIQVGGFGIMTGASLLLVMAGRRLDRRQRRATLTQFPTLEVPDLARLVRLAAIITLAVEIAIAIGLSIRFALGGRAAGSAVWEGSFHAISAFNNAGFSLFETNLRGFVSQPSVQGLVALAALVGGLGVPVLAQLRERRGGLGLHARVTLWGTAVLIVLGGIAVAAAEWTNQATLGPLGVGDKITAALFTSSASRTAGFDVIDFGLVSDETVLVTEILMFIGGGSGSTAGGIKVATAAVLVFLVLSELRGRGDVVAFNRRLPIPIVRTAFAVTALTGAIVVGCTLTILATSDFGLTASVFESVSAVAVNGLSTGITPDLPGPAKLALVIVMIVGRLGPVTLAVALIMRREGPTHRYPEESVLVG